MTRVSLHRLPQGWWWVLQVWAMVFWSSSNWCRIVFVSPVHAIYVEYHKPHSHAKGDRLDVVWNTFTSPHSLSTMDVSKLAPSLWPHCRAKNEPEEEETATATPTGTETTTTTPLPDEPYSSSSHSLRSRVPSSRWQEAVHALHGDFVVESPWPIELTVMQDVACQAACWVDLETSDHSSWSAWQTVLERAMQARVQIDDLPVAYTWQTAQQISTRYWGGIPLGEKQLEEEEPDVSNDDDDWMDRGLQRQRRMADDYDESNQRPPGVVISSTHVHPHLQQQQQQQLESLQQQQQQAQAAVQPNYRIYNHWNIQIWVRLVSGEEPDDDSNRTTNDDTGNRTTSSTARYQVVRTLIEPLSLGRNLVLVNTTTTDNNNPQEQVPWVEPDTCLERPDGEWQTLWQSTSTNSTDPQRRRAQVLFTYSVEWNLVNDTKDDDDKFKRWTVFLTMDHAVPRSFQWAGLVLALIFNLILYAALIVWVCRDLSYKPIYQQPSSSSSRHDEDWESSSSLDQNQTAAANNHNNHSNNNNNNNNMPFQRESLPPDEEWATDPDSFVDEDDTNNNTTEEANDIDAEEKLTDEDDVVLVRPPTLVRRPSNSSSSLWTKRVRTEVQLWPLSTQVFAPPRHVPWLLCTLCGTGGHLFVTTLLFIIFYRLGIINQSIGPNIVTPAVVLYTLLAPLGGLVTGRMSAMFHATTQGALITTALTALAYPIVGMIVVGFCYNVFPDDYAPNYNAWAHGSPLLMIWMWLIVPLTMVGGYLGQYLGPVRDFPIVARDQGYQELRLLLQEKQEREDDEWNDFYDDDDDMRVDPTTKSSGFETNHSPGSFRYYLAWIRHAAIVCWNKHPTTWRTILVVLTAGIPPVLCCFVAFSYGIAGPVILGYYSSTEVMSIAPFVLFVTCAAGVSVLLYYRQLRSYQYAWWWPAFVSGGACGFHLFLLTLSWLFFNVSRGNVPAGTFAIYLFWFAYICMGTTLVCGAAGVAACMILTHFLYVYNNTVDLDQEDDPDVSSVYGEEDDTEDLDRRNDEVGTFGFAGFGRQLVGYHGKGRRHSSLRMMTTSTTTTTTTLSRVPEETEEDMISRSSSSNGSRAGSPVGSFADDQSPEANKNSVGHQGQPLDMRIPPLATRISRNLLFHAMVEEEKSNKDTDGSRQQDYAIFEEDDGGAGQLIPRRLPMPAVQNEQTSANGMEELDPVEQTRNHLNAPVVVTPEGRLSSSRGFSLMERSPSLETGSKGVVFVDDDEQTQESLQSDVSYKHDRMVHNDEPMQGGLVVPQTPHIDNRTVIQNNASYHNRDIQTKMAEETSVRVGGVLPPVPLAHTAVIPSRDPPPPPPPPPPPSSRRSKKRQLSSRSIPNVMEATSSHAHIPTLPTTYEDEEMSEPHRFPPSDDNSESRSSSQPSTAQHTYNDHSDEPEPVLAEEDDSLVESLQLPSTVVDSAQKSVSSCHTPIPKQSNNDSYDQDVKAAPQPSSHDSSESQLSIVSLAKQPNRSTCSEPDRTIGQEQGYQDDLSVASKRGRKQSEPTAQENTDEGSAQVPPSPYGDDPNFALSSPPKREGTDNLHNGSTARDDSTNPELVVQGTSSSITNGSNPLVAGKSMDELSIVRLVPRLREEEGFLESDALQRKVDETKSQEEGSERSTCN